MLRGMAEGRRNAECKGRVKALSLVYVKHRKKVNVAGLGYEVMRLERQGRITLYLGGVHGVCGCEAIRR